MFIREYKGTKELRKLILDNPDLPLITFVSEDSNRGDYSYELAYVTSVTLDELAIWNDEQWMNKDDYEENLAYLLATDYAYKNLTDYQFDNLVKAQMKEVEFVKAIVIYIG